MKLVITRHEVQKALKQYYSDYEPELYKKFDFDGTEFYFQDKKYGYLDAVFVVEEVS